MEIWLDTSPIRVSTLTSSTTAKAGFVIWIAHKKGAVDLSAFHGTQGRRIVTSIHTICGGGSSFGPPNAGVFRKIFAALRAGADTLLNVINCLILQFGSAT